MGRRSLLEQVYVDVEAQFTGSPDCTPGRVGKQVVHEVFLLLCHKLGDEAVRELFGKYGPRSKSEIITYKNWMLMRLYGQAGKPSKAAFARFAANYNRGRPSSERLGSGTDDPDNMLRHLKRVLSEKNYRDMADRRYDPNAKWFEPYKTRRKKRTSRR